VAPGTAFPGSATNAALPLQQGQTITLTNWPAGDYLAEWYDPSTANLAGHSRATAANGALTLALPNFQADLAGIVHPPSKLTPLGQDPAGAFRFKFDSETGGRYWIETSTNLTEWSAFLLLTNSAGTSVLTDAGAAQSPRKYYRAEQQPWTNLVPIFGGIGESKKVVYIPGGCMIENTR